MKKTLNMILMIVLSACLRAIGVQLFLLPNEILVDGAMGIAGTLDLLFDQNIFCAAYWLLFINLPLLIAAYFKIGKKLALKTALNVFLTALFMFLIDYFNLPEIIDVAEAQHKVLYAIIGGAMFGLALPLMLSIQGSTGGSDIVVMLIRRPSSTTLMRLNLFISFATVAVGALILQSIEILVFSVVTLFCSQVTEEQIFRGYSTAVALEIVTEKPEELSQRLIKELNHGVTAVSITGMYSLTNKTQLVCVINRRQLSLARKIMRETDANAFAYAIRVKEVIGRGFVNKEEDFEDKAETD